VRRLSRNWPALLVACACIGLGLANWVSVSTVAALGLIGAALLTTAVSDGWTRAVALCVVLALLGLWWGALRLGAMHESALASEIGTAGPAELVVTGPARHSTWSTRVPVEVRVFRDLRLRERALLVLPVERSPPQGAIVAAEVAIAAPRGEENGYDERAWLERHGMHVLLRASDWRQVGRRGGVAGIGDALNRLIERAVERGAGGVHGALVLGIVLGED
jgi:hypothetical protein